MLNVGFWTTDKNNVKYFLISCVALKMLTFSSILVH